MTKTCPSCGSIFAKPVSNSKAQWRARRFCSTTCVGRKTLAQRIQSNSRAADNGCHEWTGTLNSAGYGRLHIYPIGGEKRQNRLAHRVAYEEFVGPIPDGKILMHSCDNRKCVNPVHLRPGTHRENGEDAYAKGRRVRFQAPLRERRAIVEWLSAIPGGRDFALRIERGEHWANKLEQPE